MTSSKAQIALVDPADTIFVMGAAIFTTLLSEGKFLFCGNWFIRNFMAFNLQT
jgi:hypothetical protein